MKIPFIPYEVTVKRVLHHNKAPFFHKHVYYQDLSSQDMRCKICGKYR